MVSQTGTSGVEDRSLAGRASALARRNWRVNLPLLALPAVIAAYALSPGQGRAVIYLLVDLVCAGGVILAQRGRPRIQARMWLVVALAMLISTVGDSALFLPILVHGHIDSVPGITNGAFLVAYLVTGVAMALFVRRTGATTRGDVLDACVFAFGFLAVGWPLLGLANQAAAAPAAEKAGGGPWADVVEALPGLAFPLASMLVLCIGLLAATTGAWRVPAVRGLICSAFIGFVATVVLGTAAGAGHYTPGSMYDAGWLPMYLLVLRTALADRTHPVVTLATGDPLLDTTLVTDRVLAFHRVTNVDAEGIRVDPSFRVIGSGRITALTLALVAAPLTDVFFPFSRGDEVLFLVLTSVAICLVGFRLRGLMLHVRNQATEMRSRSMHDAVTGLPNRDHLRDVAVTALASSGRSTLVFVDLDEFKSVNDTRGHAVGDRLLLAVGARLTGAARHGDLVARLGGDEFAVLMAAGHGGADDAAATADRFLAALSDPPIDLDGEQYTVRASAGVTRLESRPGVDPDKVYQEALAEADIAMYAAKRAGGGRSTRYEATLREDVLGSSELAHELACAIAAGAIDVEYQPIVTIADGKPVAMEALVRWNHPTRGRLAPAVFLPTALERGMIAELDLLVLDQALAAAATWRACPGAEHVVVHVNTSPAALARADFVGRVTAGLARHGLPGCALVVEITEQSLVEPGDHVDETLSALRAVGVFVALDDFGTGYSSLSYLDRFDIDTLKLDRSFLLHGAVGDAPTPLLKAVLQLARSLGLAVVAEGVETTEQRDSLAGMSCPLAQGFLYSRSLDVDRAVPWLAREHVTAGVGRQGVA